MSTHQIRHLVGIKASPNAVYKALTDPDQLAKWWTSDTRGTSEVGNHLEFWFGDFCQEFEVTALEPQELVRWKGTEKGIDEWVGTEITFRLKPDDTQIYVHFTHSNWGSDTDLLAHCSTKWAVFLLSLKDLLEKGKGRPSPDSWPIDHG
ncbi:MAG: SRPBCC family protein [Leptospirales bacterium]